MKILPLAFASVMAVASTQSLGASVTTTLTGSITDCGISCQSFYDPNSPISLDFEFDDSLFGTTINSVGLVSITGNATIFDPGLGWVPFSLNLDLLTVNLEIDSAGNIMSGQFQSDNLFQGHQVFYDFDLSVIAAPSGAEVHLASYSGNPISDPINAIYTGGSCFDGYSCSAVPIPAAAWLFGSALIGLAGFRIKN